MVITSDSRKEGADSILYRGRLIINDTLDNIIFGIPMHCNFKNVFIAKTNRNLIVLHTSRALLSKCDGGESN